MSNRSVRAGAVACIGKAPLDGAFNGTAALVGVGVGAGTRRCFSSDAMAGRC